MILHRCTFFVWTHVNENKPRTLDKFKEEIRLEVGEVGPEMCQRIIANFVTRIKTIVNVTEVNMTCLKLYFHITYIEYSV